MHSVINRLITSFCTLISLRKVSKYGSGIHVNRPCRFTRKTKMGDNCHFNGMVVTGDGAVTFGDNVHCAQGISILTSFHDYDHGDALPYGDTRISKDVMIGDNVWIGQDVTILAGTTIGEGAVIQAGSVVCKSIPPLAVAGGHPAVAFKTRDSEHYYSLKRAGKFA